MDQRQELINALSGRRPSSVFSQPAPLISRMDPIWGNVEDRRGNTDFGPWSAIGAALKDDASFAAEKLGLKARHAPLPIGQIDKLARDAGAEDIGKQSLPDYTLKPGDDIRPWYRKAVDYMTDPFESILYPDSITWPQREIWR